MHLVTYDQLYIDNIVRKRDHEIKLGECVKTLPWGTGKNFGEALKNTYCRYVLIGLPEDIGVRANFGRGGAYSAWQPVLNTLLNSQSNSFFRGDELLILGHIDFGDEMNSVKNLDFHNASDIKTAREIVDAIDKCVAPVISAIIESGKEPIIIGGGHNNAYPNIKGASEGLLRSGKMQYPGISVINCDAHSDFRPLEGRHSGNGFSYAFAENILERYAMVALHEAFNTDAVITELQKHKDRIMFHTFEDIYIREILSFEDSVRECISFMNGNYTGLEIDLDAIQNIPTSAKTSSGISTVEARKYVHLIASACKVAYFHIAEAAPLLSHIKTDLKTGKLVSYLIADYIKARNKYHSLK